MGKFLKHPKQSLSSRSNAMVKRTEMTEIQMLDENINWSSWPVSTWLYALNCCHMIGWLDYHEWAQDFLKTIKQKVACEVHLFKTCLCSKLKQKDVTSNKLLYEVNIYYIWLGQTNLLWLSRIFKKKEICLLVKDISN